MSNRFYRELWENVIGTFCALLGVMVGVAVFWLEGDRAAVAAAMKIKALTTSEVQVEPTLLSEHTPVLDEGYELLVDDLYIVDGKDLDELLATLQAKKEAKEQARLLAIAAAEQAKREAEEKARREAEARARAKREAQAQAQREREASARAKREAEERAKREAAERAKREREVAEQARREREAEAKAKAEREQAARQQREAQAKVGALEAPSLTGLSSLVGREGTTQAQALTWFVGALQDKMNPHWSLPPNVTVVGLDAQLFVRVDAKGKVLQVELLRSSGYEFFDNGAIQAVWKSSPLPMPNNASAVNKLVSEGIIGNFKP